MNFPSRFIKEINSDLIDKEESVSLKIIVLLVICMKET